MIHVCQEVFPSTSVNKDDFSHCENVVSHTIEPSYGRNLKSKVFSSWATCYMRQCVDNTEVGNDLRLENRKGNNNLFVLVAEMHDHIYTLFSPRSFSETLSSFALT